LQCTVYLASTQSEVKFRSAVVQYPRSCLEAIPRKVGKRGILQAEHGLKKRGAAGVTHGIQNLNESLKGNVLVSVRLQRDFARLLQQFSYCAVLGKSGA